MSTYDPLTPSQLALLQEIEAAPLTMTLGEQTQSPRGRDLDYLNNAGFLRVQAGHVSQDQNKSTWTWSRSDKPYP